MITARSEHQLGSGERRSSERQRRFHGRSNESGSWRKGAPERD